MKTDDTPGQHPENAATSPAKPSILLVDDDDNFRTIVEMNLKKLGYAVSAAGSAVEATDIAKQNSEIQLLITDFSMPGMNGVELARQIQRILPHVKVLAISGFTQKVAAGTGVWPDSIHFLQKPFLLEHFLFNLRHIGHDEGS